MGIFDFLKKNKKDIKSIDVKEQEVFEKAGPFDDIATVILSEEPKHKLSGTIKGKATVSGTLTKKPHIHVFRLFNVGGQRLVACKDCGKREANRGFINMKIAILLKQD